MAPRTHTRAEEAGYTLAEMVVVVALLLVVLVPILMTLQRGNQGSTDIRKNTEARAQARQAIDLFVRDFRQGHSAIPGVPAVEAFSTSSITFYTPDKRTPAHMRKVTYTIAGGKLTRRELMSTNTSPPWTFPATAPTNVAIDKVQPGSFLTGYDQAGAVTATAASVRSIQITIIVNGISRPGAAQTFTQTVELRTEMLKAP